MPDLLNIITDTGRSEPARLAAAAELHMRTQGSEAALVQRALVKLKGVERMCAVVNDSKEHINLRGLVSATFANLATNEDYREQLALAGAGPAMLRLFCTNINTVNSHIRKTQAYTAIELLLQSNVSALSHGVFYSSDGWHSRPARSSCPASYCSMGSTLCTAHVTVASGCWRAASSPLWPIMTPGTGGGISRSCA